MTDCIKACPTQRTDSCIHDCATGGENAPGATELGVVANCSKNKATYAADASCSFDKCALGEPRDGC